MNKNIFSKRYDIPVGTKVLIYRKVNNFNRSGLMDKYIGTIMTVRQNEYYEYKMEEDSGEGYRGMGWCWSGKCMIPISALLGLSNITVDDFVEEYNRELKKNPDYRLNLNVKEWSD